MLHWLCNDTLLFYIAHVDVHPLTMVGGSYCEEGLCTDTLFFVDVRPLTYTLYQGGYCGEGVFAPVTPVIY